MYLKSLFLKNFLSHKESFIELDSPMSIVLIGKNGAGKSSVIEGIYYGLTGKLLRDIALSETVSQGETYNRVELTIIYQGQEVNIMREYHTDGDQKRFILVRSRPIGGTDAEWKNLSTRSIQHDWNVLENLFQIDSDALRHTVIVGQEDISALSKMRPGERRDLFINMIFEGKTIQRINRKLAASLKQVNKDIGDLSARRFTLLRDVLNEEDVTQANNQIAAIQQEIVSLESVIRQYKEQGRFRKIAEIIADRPFSVEMVKAYRNSYRNQILKFKSDLEQEITRLTAYLDSLRKQYAQMTETVARIEEVRAEVANLSQHIGRAKQLKAKRDALMAERSQIQQIINIPTDLSGSAMCPCCGRTITQDDAEHVKKHRQDAAARYKTILTEIETVDGEIALAENIESKAIKRQEQLHYLERQEQERGRVKEEGKKLKQRLDNRTAFIHDFYSKHSLRLIVESPEYKKARSAAILYNEIKRKFSDVGVDEILMAMDYLKAHPELEPAELVAVGDEKLIISEVEKRVSQLHSNVATINFRLEKNGQARTMLSVIDPQIEELQKQAEVDTLLLDVLSTKDGAPAMALDEALTELSQITTAYASVLDPEVLSVDLISYRATQSQDEVPTLDIQITRKTGVIGFGALSGGERVKVSFALRVALSTLLLKSKSIMFFILDEAMSALDADSRNKLNDILRSMNVPQVLIITHLDDVAEKYPTVGYVYKDGGASYIQITQVA